MNVRPATARDSELLRALWDEWVGDGPLPPWVEGAREGSHAEIDRAVSEGGAFVAEVDGDVIGFACGLLRDARLGELTELYVRSAARRSGAGKKLVAAVVQALKDRGATYLTVGVAVDNTVARTFYERAGFRPESLSLIGELADVERRVSESASGPTFGSIHVQTDDLAAVERAVREFVPRLPGRSRGSVVAPPRNGWVGVYDDVCDRDPRQLQRLARELSDRMGTVVLALGVEHGAVARFTLLDRGSVMDEYLSVPEYHGPLPPGDVVALAANPTVVARLTGADPAAVRAVARHAASPADLAPATELVGSIAAAIGVAGGDHGWSGAPEEPDGVRIDRE